MGDCEALYSIGEHMQLDQIHLVSIAPDTGDLRGSHFPGWPSAHAWAAAQGERGIYFTVNRVDPSFTGTKPSKADIASVRFAHVDVDPTGPDWDKDAVLAELVAAGAHIVIDSGNGLQALWRVGCDVATVETINRGLIARFGADKGTWNADRLFRLPGYVNYPNAKKRAAGRVPVMASLLYEVEGLCTPEALLAAFPYAPPAPAETVDLTLGPWTVESIESLGMGDALADTVRTTSEDRSSHAYKIAVQMIASDYSDEQVVGLLMNPDYPWSGTIQEQADPERQAVRKLRDARRAGHKRPSEMFGTPPPVQASDEPPLVTAGFGVRTGGTNGRMFGDQQVQHFANCVYVTSLDKVLMPSGVLLSQSKFDVRRGGYGFIIDHEGKTTTKSAWEAFLKNPLFTPPVADDMCFRPEIEPHALVTEGNWTLVNAYVPVDTPKTEGDPSKFLDWLERVLPIERDRQILMSYCSSIVQNLGRKAQWWPVIIGTKGNGKTLLLSAMAFAHGYQYTHLPNTSKMTRNGINFNGWMRNKLFLGLEEIYSGQRRDFLEEFKPYVTNRRLPIEAKGEDEYTGDNRANGIMLTNHLDGVPIDPDERRYAPFITAQESEEDCLRDGLTSAYFSDMWDWMDGRGAYAHLGSEYGFRVINHYLHTYVPVPEFDPFQGATRRPKTSCFARAVEAGRGGVEQEVMAAIEEGRMGFSGGWVSGKYLDDLIEHSRIRVPRNKRRDLMKSIGYDWHPALEEGRPTSILQPDGMRSKLYARIGSAQAALTDMGEICRAYSQAQIETKLGA